MSSLTQSELESSNHYTARTAEEKFRTQSQASRIYRPIQLWLPGFFLAFLSGVTAYAICIQSGSLGWALFVAVPLSAGAIGGYACRVGGAMKVMLGLILVPALVLGIVSVNVAGFFCGGMLGGIFLGPMLVGLGIGSLTRTALKNSAWSQRYFLPLIIFILFPYAAQIIECSVPRATEHAIVDTHLHVHATADEAWNAVMFYEEVEHDPPLLLHMALPKPVRSVGNKQHVGQTVNCIYDRGHLKKRISEVVPGKRLAFEVIEQKLHFERDVTLKSGSFTIEPVDEHNESAGVYVRLQTTYERHLRPTSIWKPIEEVVVHSLHEHVLEGMRQHITRQRKHPVPPSYPQTNDEPTLAESKQRRNYWRHAWN